MTTAAGTLDLFGMVAAVAPPAKADLLQDEFQRWYAVYPRRKKPGDAEKAYRQARELATAAELLAGAERYALERAGQDPEFTPYPATWLRAKSWQDEPATPPEPAAPIDIDRIVAELRQGRHRVVDDAGADAAAAAPAPPPAIAAPAPDPYLERVKADQAEFAAWCEARRAAGLSDSYCRFLIERGAKGP